MLKGYTLTNNTCENPNCFLPLLRSKGVTQCPCCDMHPIIMPVEDNATISATTSEEDLVLISPMHSPLVKAETTEQVHTPFEVNVCMQNDKFLQERRQLVPKLLGALLLQGHMMLDDTCAVCPDVPLMKNLKTKELVCVSCDNALAKTAKKEVVPEVTMVEETPFVEVQEVRPTYMAVDSPAANKLPSKRSLPMEKPQSFRKAHDDVPSVYLEAGNRNMDTLNILNSKISLLASQLETITDARDIVVVAGAIEACAKAIAAIKDC
jgi:uncharacterized Zn finger protein (UPF0148 family)